MRVLVTKKSVLWISFKQNVGFCLFDVVNAKYPLLGNSGAISSLLLLHTAICSRGAVMGFLN